MTREEAIKWLEETKFGGQMLHDNTVIRVCDMAISALREQEEQENQKPLTLEELRQMDGEPVWVHNISADKLFWMLAYKDLASNRLGWLDYSDYGNTWLAYRRKPKEETK